MALDPTKIATLAFNIFRFGPDIGLSLQGQTAAFPFVESGGITENGNQWRLAEGSYTGVTVTAGVTLTVDNYLKTIGGTLAGVVNLVGLVVNANTGVYATGHTQIEGRVVTNTEVNDTGTLIIADGYTGPSHMSDASTGTGSASTASQAAPSSPTP